MNIKSSINLIRGILYLHEIIRCKSISRAAEENNMKASNLGVIINDLEKQTGTKLLKRTHLGSSPTAEGLRVAQYAVELEEQIQKIRQWHENTHPRNRTLNIYIAPNMELDDCRDFEVQHPDIKLNFIDEDILADVKVNNQPPADPAAKFYRTPHRQRRETENLDILQRTESPCSEVLRFYSCKVTSLIWSIRALIFGSS